jgi:hypothetical protein
MVFKRSGRSRREFIESYEFSPALRARLRDELGGEQQVAVALDGLRAWYLACLYAEGGLIGMPSRVVDEAWHEMILFTREYARFCEQAFGRFLHHSPESTLETSMDRLLARTIAILDANDVPLVLFTADTDAGFDGGNAWSAEDLRRLRDSNGLAIDTKVRRRASGGDDSCGGGCAGD